MTSRLPAMRPRCRLPVLLAATILLAGCGGSSSSSSGTSGGQRPVSGQLVGVMFDGPMLGAPINFEQQLGLATASGVESLRVAVTWSLLQPYPNMAAVPAAQRSGFMSVGGVPTQFRGLDLIVSAAAKQHVTILPQVQGTPGWDALRAGDPSSPPRDPTAYGRLMAGLVKRYGPNGTLWSSHPELPKVPIRNWQIWNEPHFTRYWSVQPFAPGYGRLLKSAYFSIKGADPGAKVVLAGLADFSWQYLQQIYDQPGAGKAFDVVAIHPYTNQPAGVIEILRRVRAVMDRNGDSAKPILATEITWPSSEGKAPPQFGVSATEPQQAERLAKAVPLLIANQHRLGLMGFYWYTWMGDETPGKGKYGFDYAGLLKYVSGKVTAKPALAVFKRSVLALEGCHSKSGNATVCAS